MVMIFKDTECLLFDMDGVILDNTYDNNFWQNQIPSVLAKKRQISFEDAKKLAIQIFNYKKNSKDWYDLDYWSNMLDIDIEKQKKAKESFEKIRLYEGSISCLEKLGTSFVSVTSPSLSCEFVVVPRVRVPVYSLSSDISRSCIFVALPITNIRSPVAMGSKVPQ